MRHILGATVDGRPGRTRRAPTTIVLCLVLLALAACSPSAPAAGSATFNNPLLPVDGPDPWLQFYDGNYYLMATQWSTLRMWKSPTLAGLQNVAPVTIWPDPQPSRCCNVWAPEFHLLDGPGGKRWYIYYSAGTDGTSDNQRMHVLESAGTDPLGPYTYKARLVDKENDVWSIDHSVLQLDGKLYLLFSSWVGPDQTIFIAPMSDPWTISGPRVAISKPTYDWEKVKANVNEGPEVLQHEGKTFVIYSASACWGPDYKLGMLAYSGGDPLKAESWVKGAEPVFQRSDENGVYGPGHNGFFTSPDGKESWIVYHANSSANEGCGLSRTTRVQRFEWNADGTPNFGTPVALDTAIQPPSGERGATPPRANAVYYTLSSRQGEQCLQSQGREGIAQAACGTAEPQQWALDYLANGYYRLLNRATGRALDSNGGLGLTDWTHAATQQWRFEQGADGWVRVVARPDGANVDTGACGGGAIQAAKQAETDCQLFRLTPVGDVALYTFASSKLVGIDGASTEDGAAPVLVSDATSADRRWQLVPQPDGYVQIMGSASQKCLALANPNADTVGQQPCAADESQQWRFDQMNNGTVRIVARPSGKVLDVADCRQGDGTRVRQWASLNNDCQRFRVAAPQQ